MGLPLDRIRIAYTTKTIYSTGADASLSSGGWCSSTDISVDENCFLYDFGHVYIVATQTMYFENLCCCLVKSSLFVLSIAFFLPFFFIHFFFIFRVVLRCRNRKNTDVIFCGDEKCTGTSIWNVVDCSGILQVMDMVFIWMNNSSSLFFIFVVVVLLENALTKKYYCMEPRWKKRLLPVITVTFLFYYYNIVEEGKHWMCGNCLLQVAK